VIILNRAHGLIRRFTREMDKVFRSRGDGDRTMGRSGCNSSPIPASPELREPINEAILTAAGIVVKATRWTPPRACEWIGSRKKQSLALATPVPPSLANAQRLVHHRVFTAAAVIVKVARGTPSPACEWIGSRKKQSLALATPVPSSLAKAQNLVH
jgi:hypothetical protein